MENPNLIPRSNSRAAQKSSGGRLRLVTWNVGLARGFVSHAEARVEPVARRVAELDVDIVGLQEVWLWQNERGEWVESDIECVSGVVSGVFPHAVYAITRDEASHAACTPDELAPLVDCIDERCPDANPDELAGQVLAHCAEPFMALSRPCQTCLAANLGKPLEQIMRNCVNDASRFIAGGHNGLLLLSKHPPLSQGHCLLPSALVQRAVLHALYDVPGFGRVEVYLTHLAADLSASVPYPGEAFASFEEEHAAQVEALRAYVEGTRSAPCVVVMGDMNCGPGRDGLDGELAANYERLARAPYVNAYLATGARPLPTYSASNPLARGPGQRLIDHMFVHGEEGEVVVADARRIFDEPVTIDGLEGAIEVPLSDHYGLQVELVREQGGAA